MRRQNLCLFCQNIANSKEDVIPVWIQEKIKGKNSFAVNGFAGERPIVMQGIKSNVKIKCVCYDCNTGWMSLLEGEARKLLGPLMEDINLHLDKENQMLIAKWALKTAITSETFSRKTRKSFFTRDECARFRESWEFPGTTLVCLGRYGGSFDLGIFGVDGWDNQPEHPDVMHSYICTFMFKRIVIQVAVVHPPRNLQRANITLDMVPGPWQQSLLTLNPFGPILFWPPTLSFSDKGDLSIKRLAHRFNVGSIPINPPMPDM